MDDSVNQYDSETENEQYPVEPRYHPVNRVLRRIYDFLASAKLAMFLLIAILASCLAGTTIFRDKKAWEIIFSTLWFNALLVLLVMNVAACFFGRIWGRRVTLISFGMILFHLSFVTMFLGIVYNSLFYFRGTIRLTEGESLPSGDIRSYDESNRGVFFNINRVKGVTTLVKMHTGYKADGMDKRAAYEISVGESTSSKQGIIYITKHLANKGFKYFPDKEGYSLLTILYDNKGKEVYGAHLPLQSLEQKDKGYLYTNGTKDGPTIMPFPQEPMQPFVGMNISYKPDTQKERGGEAFFQVYPVKKESQKQDEKPLATGKAPIGERFKAGDYQLSVKEVRYWTAMSVRYEPGQPMVMTSLWVGLFGMLLTTLARIFKKRTVSAKTHDQIVSDRDRSM